MAEQNWEYCELRLTDVREHDGSFLSLPGKGVSFDCFIRYYVFDGKQIDIQLAQIGKILTYNPFVKAMAFLGINGWELVSLQIGNKGGGYTVESLILTSRVAFFKRPIVVGRKVNEPELKLE